jgi:hypothetical protein
MLELSIYRFASEEGVCNVTQRQKATLITIAALVLPFLLVALNVSYPGRGALTDQLQLLHALPRAIRTSIYLVIHLGPSLVLFSLLPVTPVTKILCGVLYTAAMYPLLILSAIALSCGFGDACP